MMKPRQALFAVPIAGLASGGIRARTKRDMPMPYPDDNFHSRNVKQFT
jgi:hypothetical protein